MEIPRLDNWKEKLQNDLESIGNKREDIQRILDICDQYDHEIKNAFQWFSDQSSFIQQIKMQYFNLYQIRFNNPPEQEKIEAKTNKIILRTKKERSEMVKKIAMELASPGNEINCKQIYDELARRNIGLDAEKPTAVISTIMWGYKEEFEQVKAKGKKGIFKRKQPNLSLKPSDAI
jgi:uncharacterized protein Smg (DUF494 family)